jgi:uncharacterized membrane protein
MTNAHPVTSIPKSEAVRFGWATFTKHAFFLVGVYVVVAAITVILQHASDMESIEGLPKLLVKVASFFAGCVLELGLIAIALEFRDGRMPEFGDLFNRVPLVFKYAAASILYSVLIVIGLFLFIVPGIYLAIRLLFFGYFIVDRGAGPIESFELSSELTSGVKLELFLFVVLLILVNVLGLLCLGVGVLASMPVSALAMAWVFRYLEGPKPDAEGQQVPLAA